MPPSSPASSAHWQAWRAYFETTALLEARLEASLKSTAGLTLADYNILLALSEADGAQLRLGELADRVVFSPSRLTYRIRELQRRGLIERIADATDGRGASARLTAAGSTAFRDAARIHARDVTSAMLAELSDDEAAALYRVFTRVRAAL
ncbi:hypothetical protein BSZ39_11230 [Bowdeniella nasicola]|uniref:HTH marR-type domain-containing protein n=1 Tax=Bowdeniella nasicola TaxID=208480 RepID=A0A1Q5Q087_9ACTO|nr:MarR family transcriptional regulator [Bowdeniella nasicola]OKL53109.1 hypothetical protein BSZ39_11230 [Bowdeniella nasicola]